MSPRRTVLGHWTIQEYERRTTSPGQIFTVRTMNIRIQRNTYGNCNLQRFRDFQTPLCAILNGVTVNINVYYHDHALMTSIWNDRRFPKW